MHREDGQTVKQGGTAGIIIPVPAIIIVGAVFLFKLKKIK